MSFVCQYRSRERRHNNPLWQRSTAHAGFASANFIARTRNVAIKAIPPRVCVCIMYACKGYGVCTWKRGKRSFACGIESYFIRFFYFSMND